MFNKHSIYRFVTNETLIKNRLVHQGIKSVLISAFALDTTTDFLSVLELNESGDRLELDERMGTVGMVRITLSIKQDCQNYLVSFSLH